MSSCVNGGGTGFSLALVPRRSGGLVLLVINLLYLNSNMDNKIKQYKNKKRTTHNPDNKPPDHFFIKLRLSIPPFI
jgi:CBS-domain-containing membrane protein